MGLPSLNDISDYLASCHAIECGERLGLGNVVSTVFRAKRGEQSLVVKIGLGERAAAEVRNNRLGYEEMVRIGAQELIPGELAYEEFGEVPILIMEDCGSDFWHAAHAATDPVGLYRRLAEGMDRIYRKTKINSKRVIAAPKSFSLDHLRSRLARQYTDHLQSFVRPGLASELMEDSARIPDFPAICFSTFDFTPEDVFVSDLGVKKADPLLPLLGIPVIDLACFAGVARDAHHLPGSEKGYTILEDYATRDLPGVLDISGKTATRLFCFGRALQSALSARFRKETEPQAARKMAEASQVFLRQFLEMR